MYAYQITYEQGFFTLRTPMRGPPRSRFLRVNRATCTAPRGTLTVLRSEFALCTHRATLRALELNIGDNSVAMRAPHAVSVISAHVTPQIGRAHV